MMKTPEQLLKDESVAAMERAAKARADGNQKLAEAWEREADECRADSLKVAVAWHEIARCLFEHVWRIQDMQRWTEDHAVNNMLTDHEKGQDK